MSKKIIIVGSGNAALSAGIAALEKGAKAIIYEKADKTMAGGNTKYTAGAMRFAYENGDQLMGLLKNAKDERKNGRAAQRDERNEESVKRGETVGICDAKDDRRVV